MKMLNNSNNSAALQNSSTKSSNLFKKEPPLVLQSPLSGVSDRCFRQLVRRWAPDALLFTEMVNATSLELGFGRYKVEELADEIGPVAVQLFDHRPTALAEAARRAVIQLTQLVLPYCFKKLVPSGFVYTAAPESKVLKAEPIGMRSLQ